MAKFERIVQRFGLHVYLPSSKELDKRTDACLMSVWLKCGDCPHLYPKNVPLDRKPIGPKAHCSDVPLFQNPHFPWRNLPVKLYLSAFEVAGKDEVR